VSDNRLYLIHIIESVERIEDYPRGGWEVFSDKKTVRHAATCPPLRILHLSSQTTS